MVPARISVGIKSELSRSIEWRISKGRTGGALAKTIGLQIDCVGTDDRRMTDIDYLQRQRENTMDQSS
jgi:hypothetical protein